MYYIYLGFNITVTFFFDKSAKFDMNDFTRGMCGGIHGSGSE